MAFFFRLEKFRYMQYVCVFIVSLLQCALSMVSNWMSPVLPLLLSDETPLNAPLTQTEETWLVSGEKLGAIVGCLVAAILTDLIGRKRMLFISAIPYIVVMFVIAFVKSAVVVITLRVLSGVSTGIIFAVLPVYVSEVSEKDIRGQLGIMQLVLSTLGSVYIYSVGPFISYLALTLSVAIFSLAFLVPFFFMPETPYYLVKKGNLSSATKSLKQLSLVGLSDDVIASRLEEIQEYVNRDIENKGSLKELIFDRSNQKALIITLVLRTVLVLSGLFVLLNYLQKLVGDSGSSISPEVSSIIFGVINLPSVLATAVLIDKLGRRPLFLISTFGCAVALIAVGIYYYLKFNADASDILWLPTTGLCAFAVLACLGINSVPGVIQGEMFSINVKSIASSIIMIYGSAISFLLLRFFQPLVDALGMHAMFWFFGMVCVLGFLFGLFLLPETKGKTFSEIQELLDKRKD